MYITFRRRFLWINALPSEQTHFLCITCYDTVPLNKRVSSAEDLQYQARKKWERKLPVKEKLKERSIVKQRFVAVTAQRSLKPNVDTWNLKECGTFTTRNWAQTLRSLQRWSSVEGDVLRWCIAHLRVARHTHQTAKMTTFLTTISLPRKILDATVSRKKNFNLSKRA